jgi:hypothetical protein
VDAPQPGPAARRGGLLIGFALTILWLLSLARVVLIALA